MYNFFAYTVAEVILFYITLYGWKYLYTKFKFLLLVW